VKIASCVVRFGSVEARVSSSFNEKKALEREVLRALGYLTQAALLKGHLTLDVVKCARTGDYATYVASLNIPEK